jgi:hypothetical protein
MKIQHTYSPLDVNTYKVRSIKTIVYMMIDLFI